MIKYAIEHFDELHFNSIKVRLELLREQIKQVSQQDFNSIKVRLELPPRTRPLPSPPAFQFHKGTIRTANRPAFMFCGNNFNSIKVRLEPYPGYHIENTGKAISIP